MPWREVPKNERCSNAEQIAEDLHLTASTIRRLARRGVIGSQKVMGRWMFSREDVTACPRGWCFSCDLKDRKGNCPDPYKTKSKEKKA